MILIVLIVIPPHVHLENMNEMLTKIYLGGTYKTNITVFLKRLIQT